MSSYRKAGRPGPRQSGPFTTRPGAVPEFLLDRDELLDDIVATLDFPLGGPLSNVLLTGPRGMGKTVMLNQAATLAGERDWLVVRSYLSDTGLIRHVTNRLYALAASHARVSDVSLSAFGFGVTVGTSRPGEHEENLCDLAGRLLEATHAPGIIFTIDEVHATSGDAQAQLRTYGNEVQLMQGMNLPVISIMAGLPGGIAALLRDRSPDGGRTAATFLRRSAKRSLGPISSLDVWNAYSEAAAQSGRRISPTALDMLTAAADGYPYLFQLVGQRVWQEHEPDISDDAAGRGIASALDTYGRQVLDTALADLSPLEHEFITVMATCDDPVSMRDVSRRLGISPQQASNYKSRLIASELIRGGQGTASFTMPYMREHLRTAADQTG
jgi:hypothetical protein